MPVVAAMVASTGRWSTSRESRPSTGTARPVSAVRNAASAASASAVALLPAAVRNAVATARNSVSVIRPASQDANAATTCCSVAVWRAGRGSGCRSSRAATLERPMRGVSMFEYKVVEIREGMLGGKMSGDKLEKILNEQAGQGWQLKALTSVEVKGRVGPGGVEGLLVTFERSA